MGLIAYEAEKDVIKHDHSVKEFEFRGTRYQYDEWMLNKLNSMFGGSAIACYTPKVTVFRTEVLSHLSIFLFFDDRLPTFIQISEWMTLDRLQA